MKKSIRNKIISATNRTRGLRKIYTKKDLAQLLQEKKREFERINSFEFLAQARAREHKIQQTVESVFSTDEAQAEYKRKIDLMHAEIAQLGKRERKIEQSQEVVKSKRRIKYEQLIDSVLNESKRETIL